MEQATVPWGGGTERRKGLGGGGWVDGHACGTVVAAEPPRQAASATVSNGDNDPNSYPNKEVVVETRAWSPALPVSDNGKRQSRCLER